MTSAAVDSNPNGVVTRSLMATTCGGDGLLGVTSNASDKRCGGVLFGHQVDGLACPDRHVVGVAAADPLAERGPGRIVDIGLAALPDDR